MRPKPKNMIHFSHPHELQLWRSTTTSTFHPELITTTPSLIPICSCCKLPQPQDPMYHCMGCNFFLHLSCAQFPQLITHPSHRNHTLTLLPTAAYPGGSFNCDACNRRGNGFSYHCSSCEYDLHVKCASKPLKITHQFHSCPLELAFTNPYDNAKGFSCDVCHRIGSKEWLYRCSACEFDVHMDCTASSPSLAAVPGGLQAQFLLGGRVQSPVTASGQSSEALLHYHHHQLMHSASVGANPTAHRQFRAGNAAAPAAVHGQVMRPSFVHSASSGQLGSTVGQSSSLMMSSVFQELVEGASQGVGQGLVQGMIGGGGSGGGGDIGLYDVVFGDSSRAQN